MDAKRRTRLSRVWIPAAVLVTVLAWTLPASAHLMVAQHGTLKFGKGGAYFIVSLPVSALGVFDDDGDGLLSAKELATHRELIKEGVQKGFVLEHHKKGPCAIEGLLLNRPHQHGHAKKTSSHIIAMGRFKVGNQDHRLTLKMTLFGVHERERRFKITITRGADKEIAVLNERHASHRIFAKK